MARRPEPSWHSPSARPDPRLPRATGPWRPWHHPHCWPGPAGRWGHRSGGFRAASRFAAPAVCQLATASRPAAPGQWRPGRRRPWPPSNARLARRCTNHPAPRRPRPRPADPCRLARSGARPAARPPASRPSFPDGSSRPRPRSAHPAPRGWPRRRAACVCRAGHPAGNAECAPGRWHWSALRAASRNQSRPGCWPARFQSTA